MLKKIAEIVREHHRFVITTHVHPEGDAIGSAMGLKRIIESLGKQAWVVNSDPVPGILHFLDPQDEVELYDAEKSAERFKQCQVHITVDVNAPKRIGSAAEAIESCDCVKVVIDHHPPENHFGQYVYIVPEAAATGVLVYDLMEMLEVQPTEEIARLLYVAIMTDTGGFRFSNTDAHALRACAALIEAGAQPQDLYGLIYETWSMARFRLFQKVLLTTQFASENRIAWTICPRIFFEQTGTNNSDLEDFVNIPRWIRQVEISLMFSEAEDGRVRISCRSKNHVPVNELAKQFGGGGHSRAAGTIMSCSLEEAQAQVVAAAKRLLKQSA